MKNILSITGNSNISFTYDYKFRLELLLVGTEIYNSTQIIPTKEKKRNTLPSENCYFSEAFKTADFSSVSTRLCDFFVEFRV